jgi:hypothetical protein
MRHLLSMGPYGTIGSSSGFTSSFPLFHLHTKQDPREATTSETPALGHKAFPSAQQPMVARTLLCKIYAALCKQQARTEVMGDEHEELSME